ncbi:MAG: PhoH-like ATPase [Patiriisocius sp.]|jgi:PhoH-like ATPase
MSRTQGMKKKTGGSGSNGTRTRSGKKHQKKHGIETKHVKHSIPKVLRRIPKDTTGVITYVLDTNVIMTAWDSLFKFEEHEVCIVGQVWAELDNHKKGHSSEAWNVRKAIRCVDQLMIGKTPEEIAKGILLTPPSEILNGKPHTGKLIFDFSLPKLDEALNISLDENHPDDRIILICLKLKAEGKRVVLVSNDGSCRVKATVVGITAEEYLSDAVHTIQGEEDHLPGFHEMPEDFMETAVDDCTVVDQTRTRYTLKHAALKDVASNEFLVMPDAAHLRVVSRDDSGNVIAESFKFLKEISAMGIKTRNDEQGFALQLLLDPDVPGVSLAGKAGSGKTYLTLAAGIHMMDNLNLYKRIIYTRSLQGSDEDIGFLKGDMKEKISPWMGALWDNIASLRGNGDDLSEDDELKMMKGIQITALNFVKGRSITDTLFIVDETQDLSPKALKMVSTRVGEGSKIVFLGNVAQIDNPHLTEHTCGLSVFIRKMQDADLCGHVTLQNGERSAFATLAEERL